MVSNKANVFRTSFLSCLHQHMEQSSISNIRNFYETIKTQPFHFQIRSLFEQLPLFYSGGLTEIISCISEALACTVERYTVDLIQSAGFRILGKPSFFCGPSYYELNADGDFELSVDLSVTCENRTVVFISIKCTQYDLLTDSGVHLICDMIERRVLNKLGIRQQIS
ncbi:hypothetical protein [Priestia koreensis]|uniref:Uncharacterized protein n=2 Tax=Priestia koreensis TaxID=284581 RepID=A0A0M0LIL1_9BACI|nr:hypothetical protein [Priestia koreensis]KOO50821.1 hypothetical protein AMD01_03550 [Priestia koreensis]